MKISRDVQHILNISYQNAKEHKHEYISPEHLLYVSLFFEEVQFLFKECNVHVLVVLDTLDNYFNKYMPELKREEPIQSEGFRAVLQRALEYAEKTEKHIVEIEDLLLALLEVPEDSYAAYALKKAGLKRELLLKKRFKKKTNHSFIKDNPELSSYFQDLTDLAKKKKLDPLVGRQDLIDRTIEILARRTKNNPLHIGESGVGKTILTEGLAQRIVDNEVPPFLRNYKIYSLDLALLIAGTRYRGDLEERFKNLFFEISQDEKTIIYIDEIHLLTGSGGMSNMGNDISSLLKPFLAKGSLRFIGSTTFEDYKKSIEKNKTISRQFQKIVVEEPTDRETLDILKALKSRYELHHNVHYNDDFLTEIIQLSKRYLKDKVLPDKAIDVLDETGAYMRLHYPEQKRVSKKVLYNVLSHMSNLKIEKQNSNAHMLQNLEKSLKKTVFGQDEIIKTIAEVIKRSKAGLRKKNKPLANFLFVGNTGVGKTELAIQLAKQLKLNFQRFDMSEYQEKHAVSRFIGSPPGYIGYEEGGLLVDTMRKAPHTLLLFDEIEKAHPDIYNTFLQILDDASLTDGMGRKCDFQEAVIIFTSNIGSKEANRSAIGFLEKENEKAYSYQDSVEKIFNLEFINRLDRVLVFNPLSKNIIKKITLREIEEFREKLLTEHGIYLEVSEKAVNWLSKEGYSPIYGARNLIRFVEHKLKDPFVDIILFENKKRFKASVDIDENGKLTIKKQELKTVQSNKLTPKLKNSYRLDLKLEKKSENE